MPEHFDVTQFLTWYVVLIVSMVAHEAAHAFAAYLGGDRTAYEAGQVTLNPWPHMRREPFGTIILPILGYLWFQFPFGFAHAPYSPYWADRHPKRAALMSFAGPAANLLITLLALAILQLGLAFEWFEAWPLPQRPGDFLARMEGLVVAADDPRGGALYAVVRILCVLLGMNLILGVFNLMPIPPLDGAGIAEGLLPGPLGGLFRQLRSQPMIAILGLILCFRFAGVYVLWPVIQFMESFF